MAMNIKLKMIGIGNSVGAIFPREMLSDLNVDRGDTLIVTRSPDGYRLTPYDPDVQKQIDAGREFMHEYRDTLHALAK
jgi:putative addiction module antidote